MKTYAQILFLTLNLCACGDDTHALPDAATPDGAADAPAVNDAAPDALTCSATPSSSIRHLIVIVQENHSFDSYFGTYCTAPTGSSPTCTTGAACCEAGPATDPGTGMAPQMLDDTANGSYDPDHHQECELAEMNGGQMDRFVAGASCSSELNFAYAGAAAQPYRQLAQSYALADRYFQPIAGQSSSNDMYLARAKFVFVDNQVTPTSIGSSCNLMAGQRTYDDPTIADLLSSCSVSWAFYAEGYADMKQAVQGGGCPTRAAGCHVSLGIYPCVYDPSDVPFEFYRSLQDDPNHFKDLAQLSVDLTAGTLPQVTFVKFMGYKSEHPGYGDFISDGATATTDLIGQILASSSARDTLVLLTYDESGGYFDHVAPPPTSTIDNQPYGPRVPTLAIGRFARQNFISHVTMEHSSIVKFIEWNWLGGQTGQLGTRDTTVNNIGSLLDPAETGTPVPSN